jgi:hypothetical protein
MSWFAQSKSGAGDHRQLSASEMASQIAAVDRSQPVIELTPDGQICGSA